jgi:hypothetical protein
MSQRIRQNLNFMLWRFEAWRCFRRAGKQSDAAILKSKQLFLEYFSAAFPVTEGLERRMTFRRRALIYGFSSFSLLLATSGGAIVFADQKNVSATHPLYGLKRTSENIRLALSSAQKRTELESAFAERRLDEIQKIQTDSVNENAARATLIKKLDADFENHIDAALERIDDSPASTAQAAKNASCQNITQAIERHTKMVPDKGDWPKDLSKLKNKCAKPQEKAGSNN